MEKENKDINSIFIEIRKNIDGEFLYSEKWTTDDFDFEYNSLESNDPKDFVELHDLLIELSPSLSFSDYLQINKMIKLEKKRVGDDDSRWTVNRWRINLNDLLSFLAIKGYIKKKDFSYLLEDKFRKVIYKDIDEIVDGLPNEIKKKIDDGILYSSPFTISYYHHHDNVADDEKYVEFEDWQDYDNIKTFPEFDQFIEELVPNIKFEDYLYLKGFVSLRELETSELEDEYRTKISSKYRFRVNIKNVIAYLRRGMNYYI